MKKRILMAAAMLVVGASLASAEGINLSWNDCGQAGLPNMAFACNTNSGDSFTMVGSFIAPAGGLPEYVGMVAQLDIRTADPVLPDWWRHGSGQCRGTTGLTTSFDFTSGPFTCTDFFNGHAAGGFIYDVEFPTPNRARLRIVCQVPFDNRGPIDDATEYYAFKVNLSRAKTTGAGSCTGCAVPACIVLEQIQLFQPPDQNNDPIITIPVEQNYVTWQGGPRSYRDADGDGYGHPSSGFSDCPNPPPSGNVSNSSDCDDTRASVHPGAPEPCDGLDNDCDGQVDDNSPLGPSGLVGLWEAEGNANDATGSHHGVLRNGATLAPGQVQQAFSLDGIDDYVEIPDSPELRFTSDFTLEAWIRPDSPLDYDLILGKWGVSGGGNHAYKMWITPNGELRFDVSGDGTIYDAVISPSSLISPGTWSHVAALFSAGRLELYINGSSVAAHISAITSVHPGLEPLHIGRTVVNSGQFDGSIDEAAVYDRALLASGIQAIYEAGAAGRCGLVASPADWNSRWHSSTGLYPDASCPWVLFDDANPEAPVLSQNVLTLATSAVDENMGYEQTEFLTIPDTLRISARLRVVSEIHQVGNPRRGVSIGFAVGQDSANILFFDRDSVFLWSANGQQGPTAYVDIDGAFHTYEIRVVNRSAITVYLDGAPTPILTGAILVDPGFADAPALYWGDGTGNASAVSEWLYVRHNANTIECGTGTVGVPSGPRTSGSPEPAISLIQYPNPARGPATFGIHATAGLSQPAWVRIYDVTGRIVRSLKVGPVMQGLIKLHWDGNDDRGRAVSSGVFLLHLEVAGRRHASVKATVLR